MAVKPSGSAARVGRLLSFLGGHGESGYSLSELARAVGMDKSTCQAMLLALVEQGFVLRDDGHRTYALGPSALAVAAADGDRARLARLARAELESLTADLDLETSATTTFAGALLVLARVPRSALFGLSMRVGQTLPLRPPVGAVHLAWAPPAAVDAWLARAGEPVGRHRRVLDAVRERGYSVTADNALRWRLRDVVDQVAEAPTDPDPRRERDELLRTLAERDYEILDPDEAKSWPVGEICAPVFGRDGRVAVAVGLVAAQTLDTARRAAMVDRLLVATTRLTALTGGRPPD
ncbi:helix-turn-helix domain-containing protein [Frankia sp. AiPs1]|uniref:helix-turn-helix domain-containing protein n=1 Tax=Frankia sp. AiPs1 TaxID=573493 RepID=UPI002044A559|nr:helix-turn-helix domain-containing protein [Frankia sp. AiPs1]MCM3921658.1 helix-turn-helix domain-containing protein [Frankia sp. AiPs1]